MNSGYSSDGWTVTEILQEYEAEGYAGQFASRPDGFVMCFSCHQLSPAREVHVHEMRRTEGASDPADMLAVVGMTCPRCDARGTLVVNYGPEITLDDAVVLRALEH